MLPGSDPALLRAGTLISGSGGVPTPVLDSMKDLLGETLGLGERSARLTAATPLLGEMPELDSLAVVQLALAIERTFGITIPDEDFSSELFASVGSLVAYVEQRIGAAAPAMSA